MLLGRKTALQPRTTAWNKTAYRSEVVQAFSISAAAHTETETDLMNSEVRC